MTEVEAVRTTVRTLVHRATRLRGELRAIVIAITVADVAAVLEFVRLVRAPSGWLVVGWLATVAVMIASVVLGVVVQRQLTEVLVATRRVIAGWLVTPPLTAGSRSGTGSRSGSR